MLRPIAPLLACLLLIGCAGGRVDLARMPADMYAGQDLDDAVLLDLHRGFNARAPLPSDPRAAAKLLAEVDYFAGEINAGGRWSDSPGIVQTQMLQARGEVRAALGVAPGTTSQQLVDALLAVSRASDRAAQLAALSSPIFTLGAAGTLDRLSHLPPLPLTETATGRAGVADTSFD